MVKIVQLLCPMRHCVLATAYEEEHGNFIEACNAIEAMVGERGPCKRRCMLCGSVDLRFDEQSTIFLTLAQAAPTLLEQQSANVARRRLLDSLGLTIEPLEKNCNKLGRRIGPGIWEDANGDTHYSLTELLQMVDLPDTPENRAQVKKIVYEAIRQKNPAAKIVEREQP